MIEFCTHEKHGGVCDLTDGYCNLGACPYEKLQEFVPVRHGRWDIMANTKTRHMCSSCGWDVPEYGKFYSYCPNCGAHMKKEDKSDG